MTKPSEEDMLFQNKVLEVEFTCYLGSLSGMSLTFSSDGYSLCRSWQHAAFKFFLSGRIELAEIVYVTS